MEYTVLDLLFYGGVAVFIAFEVGTAAAQAVLGGFFVAYMWGKGTTIANRGHEAAGKAPAVVQPTSTTDCKATCDQYKAAEALLASMRAVINEVQKELDNLRRQIALEIAAAAAYTALAIAALTGLFTAPAAVGFFIAAGIATAGAIHLQTKLPELQAALDKVRASASEAEFVSGRLRAMVYDNCPPDEAKKCVGY